MLVTDQLGVPLTFDHPPRKIISLVPSQTELLYALGLDASVIGITTFCIHPSHWKKTKTIIGGTKKIHTSKIFQLEPDCVIANKEENVREEVLMLAERFPVYTSDVSTLSDAVQMIRDIGRITGKEAIAESIILKISTAFENLSRLNFRRRKAAYLIWKNPYMTIGGDTFINDMMQRSGFDNVFAASKRYPVIHLQQIEQAGCDVIFCSTEPYPFKVKDVEELRKRFPRSQVILVDGEAFSWYGSRLTETPAYLEKLHNNI